MITDLEVFPGSRVTESELAEHFKVSRTPVREALKRLEVEKLVEIRPKQGCFIRQVDIEEISNYYDVRVALESMAVELACQNMPKEELKALMELWNPENCKTHAGYPDKIRELEESFHINIAIGSRNPVIVKYLTDVNDHIRIIRRLGFPDDKSIIETYQEHYQICELISNNKVSAARKFIIAHIRKSQDIAKTVTMIKLQSSIKKPDFIKMRILKKALN